MKELQNEETYTTLNPEVCIQYSNREIFQDDLIEQIKKQYFTDGNLEKINRLQIYIKPEENKAYYIVNDAIFGNVNL